MKTKTGKIVPSIGKMVEPVCICDGAWKPSGNETLELVQQRKPLWCGLVQIEPVRTVAIADYRPDEPDKKDEPTHIVLLRTVPGLIITNRCYVFWTERRSGLEANHWLRVHGIGMAIRSDRFTVLETCLQFRTGLDAPDHAAPQGLRGWTPPYSPPEPSQSS
ncbi:MAG: hypothetical protein AB7F96_16425 [Beijerinckiaceae bacterium]